MKKRLVRAGRPRLGGRGTGAVGAHARARTLNRVIRREG